MLINEEPKRYLLSQTTVKRSLFSKKELTLYAVGDENSKPLTGYEYEHIEPYENGLTSAYTNYGPGIHHYGKDIYQMIYLDIAERQAEVEAEDKRTRDYWRKERTQDEARWNKQWEGFDSLVAYYSQSAEKYEMLMKRTDEYARTDSKYSDLVRNIANEAEERSYVGNVFMGIGGALFALGLMKLLRDLQLLGRFSRLTKYCTF